MRKRIFLCILVAVLLLNIGQDVILPDAWQSYQIKNTKKGRDK